jgi:hypothetical protein
VRWLDRSKGRGSSEFLNQPNDWTKLSPEDKTKHFSQGYAECACCKKREYDEAKVQEGLAHIKISWIAHIKISWIRLYSNIKEVTEPLLLCSDCFDKFWVDFLGRKQLFPSNRKKMLEKEGA